MIQGSGSSTVGGKCKVLLVGSGARESALAVKLKQSELLDELFVYSDNPWILRQGRPISAAPGWEELAAAAQREGIGLVVCGPEGPLAEGLADACGRAGVACFGPSAEGAKLESSKAFAKQVMKEAGIRTAAFQVTSGRQETRAAAAAMLGKADRVVLKASGLASGKGVFLCQGLEETDEALDALFGPLKSSSAEIVVEEFLQGRESSFFVFLGGPEPVPVGFAVDYKRLRDGDEGPNTGGMGCYAPVGWLKEDAGPQVMREIVEPLGASLSARGISYVGCLYVGLMWTSTGPYVIEFNCRLGDPEAQVLTVADRRDWLALMLFACGKKSLKNPASDFAASGTPLIPSVAVVLASKDYALLATGTETGPGSKNEKSVSPASGDLPARFLGERAADRFIFPASVKESGPAAFKTGGGRILTAAARGRNFQAAREAAYALIQEAVRDSEGEFTYRTDIARLTE